MSSEGLNKPAVFASRDVEFTPASMAVRSGSSYGPKKLKPAGIPKSDWNKRYTLFSRFDWGIQMDPPAWFEVTPENIAEYVSRRIPHDSCVLDGFCGVGGNTIQFGRYNAQVIAVDLSNERLQMCRHNTDVYGVDDRVKFVHADILVFLRSWNPERDYCFYASPPWGGKKCYDNASFALESFPVDLKSIIKLALEKVDSIILHVPRNMDLNNLATFLGTLGIDYFEVERVIFTEPERRLKCLLVYIDKHTHTRSSVLAIGRSLRRATIANFLGTSPSARLLTRAYIQTSYLGRFIATSFLRYQHFSGIMFGELEIS